LVGTKEAGAALIAQIAAATVLLRADKIRRLLGKANFDPNQPRVPRGHRDGGRWIAVGVNHGRPATDRDQQPDRAAESRPFMLASHEEDDLPEIPREPPQRPRDRYDIARLGVEVSSLARTIRILWGAYDLANDVVAYFDEPKTLEELQRAVDEWRSGYDVHHIVEQGPARREGYPEEMINAPENKVRIPRFRHWEINKWYGEKNVRFNLLTPREYLRGKTWKERRWIDSTRWSFTGSSRNEKRHIPDEHKAVDLLLRGSRG
jgi:hypothetical protein